MKVIKGKGSAIRWIYIALAAFLALMVSCSPGAKADASWTPDAPAAGVGDPSSVTQVLPEGGPPVIKKAADPSNVCFVPSEDARARLGDAAYSVVAEGATEVPFRNAYWDNHEEGVYVDIVDGTPLFTSREKYDSGTGWPSFWSPIDQGRLELVEDLSYGMRRVEVRSASSGAHLGHVFEDGPKPSGMRYCMNSAALRFIPKSELAREGYGELLPLFD